MIQPVPVTPDGIAKAIGELLDQRDDLLKALALIESKCKMAPGVGIRKIALDAISKAVGK